MGGGGCLRISGFFQKGFLCLPSGKLQDQLVEMLEKEADFSSSKTILEEELEKLGAKCIFTPKFHPELNPIESCYRYRYCSQVWFRTYPPLDPFIMMLIKCRDVSNYCRDRNVVGCSKGFVQRIIDADEVVTPEKCRKYFVNMQRF